MFAQKLTFCFDRMTTLEDESVKHIQNAITCKTLETVHSLRRSKRGGGGGGVDSCSLKNCRFVSTE